jgi:hypothetical protein
MVGRLALLRRHLERAE